MALSLEPQQIDDTHWYYERKDGLLVLHQVRDENGYWISTHEFRIPWSMIDESLARRPRTRRAA